MSISFFSPSGLRADEMLQFQLDPTTGSSLAAVIVSSSLADDVQSFVISSVDSRQDDDTYNQIQIGFEPVRFSWRDETFVFHRKQVGDPQGLGCDTRIHETYSLSANSVSSVQSLCKYVNDELVADKDGTFQTFSWNCDNEYWRRDGYVKERSFDSVVLDATVKKRLLDDLDDFAADDTMEWYSRHCIAQRRGILLHGPPGTGKTSTIAAIATRMKRNICRVNLVAPRLCDDSLLRAINSVKKRSIVVMEDMDALFDHREKNDPSQRVTFSGLLNAIDGLNDHAGGGLIYLFTSNHPDKLDPALRRKGRIDLELHLGLCTRTQTNDMFLRFYPGETESAKRFTNTVHDKTNPTPAQLQHHFIINRKSSAAVAARDVDVSDWKCDSDISSSMWR